MQTTRTVQVRVDAAHMLDELPHRWAYIGYDECNYTHTPEGEALLAAFGALQDAPYYVRTHHLLCTGNCHGAYKWGSTNVYTEDEHGNPVYSWDVIDRIFDVYLRNNCKPFVELGFMPMDLAEPGFLQDVDAWNRFRAYKDIGWACPPKDYQKWYDLVYQLVRHCVSRYGQEEVLTWYWELWNEPDIFYWNGTFEEFCALYDYTEAAVHAALPEARLGGPATCGPTPGSPAHMFLENFLKHCTDGTNAVSGEQGTRLDFVTFHAKGGGFPFMLNAPKSPPSINALIEQVKLGLETIKRCGYGDREVVLSEADPDGWAAGGMYDNANMNFRNTEYYASYIATSYHHIDRLSREMQMDVRPLAWAFLFIGERCFEGTRTFSTQGIPKASFNMFKLYARLGHQRLACQCLPDSSIPGDLPEVLGMAAQSEDGSIQVMLSSHHDDWDVGVPCTIELSVEHLPFDGPVVVEHYRIDADHSNTYAEWVRQGKPSYPNPQQYEAIKARSYVESPEPIRMLPVVGEKILLTFPLPAHAISLIEISPAAT